MPRDGFNSRAFHQPPSGGLLIFKNIRCITSNKKTCIFLKFEYNNNCSEGRGKRNEAPDKSFGVRHTHRQPHLQVPKEQKKNA